MKTTHKGLNISDSDWQVFMRHAAATLEKLQVPATEKDKVLAFLSSLKGDVTERTQVEKNPHAALFDTMGVVFAIVGAILLLSGPTANMSPEEMQSH